MFKLALLQMKVQGGDKAANLAAAERLIARAAAAGSQVTMITAEPLMAISGAPPMAQWRANSDYGSLAAAMWDG
ncbi:MAG: hypothetical protein N3A66_08600 [Planctomycetota bacterium]|nr:hypothetical protein [Planctomycetota bacterium]